MPGTSTKTIQFSRAFASEDQVLVVSWGRWNQFLGPEPSLVLMLRNGPSFGCSLFLIDSLSVNDSILIPVKKGVYPLISARELVSPTVTNCVT
jgi:hypothetical protein